MNEILSLGVREKLSNSDTVIQQLEESELLAALLRTGTASPTELGTGRRVDLLAKSLLSRFESLSGVFSASREELSDLSGIGPAKVASLLAAAEIARRLGEPKVQNPASAITKVHDAYLLFRSIENEPQEVVWAAFLNARLRVLRKKEIFRGTLTNAPACPREILREALRANGARVIIAHNHPSGNPDPSEEDCEFTAQLELAAQCLGIPLLDHLILAKGGHYFSFAEAKRIGRRTDEGEKRRGYR